MVGLSGVVGPAADAADPETVPPTVPGEVAGTYRERGLAVRSAFHPGTATDQPVEAADGTLVWVWGEVYGVVDPRGGRATVDPAETARVCAEEYDEHGREFVTRLDGEFVGLLYDAGTATFFVDRLGARPLYYTVGDDGVAFSTNVQTVPALPGTAPAFDRSYLAEYLYARRTFGTKTPVAGIEQIAPATLLTYAPDAGDEGLRERQYWEPRYRPVDRPPSYFVRELADRFRAAVADRTPEGDEHGLLLSGGSDSRAVLAAADPPPTGLHLGDGWNREARVAKRAADAAGARFELLNRGPEYHATLLRRAAPIMEFVGPFNTGHALGFAEEIGAEVDTLLTGLYSDALFGPWSIPQPTVPLPFGVELSVPTPRLPATAADYVAQQVTSQPTRDPAFLREPAFEEILAANVGERNGRIDHHGVEYASPEQLAISEFYYPITNGIGFDLYSALQIAPVRNPFLDRRLIDLHLSMPLRYRLRHDVVHRAIRALDPSLAAVPHASTGLPIEYPRAAHVVGRRARSLRGKLDRSPPSYRTEGPWQDKDEVIRTSDFVGRALDDHSDRIGRLPGVDPDAVRETYRRHRARETDAGEELYRLVTVLETPLARRLLG